MAKQTSAAAGFVLLQAARLETAQELAFTHPEQAQVILEQYNAANDAVVEGAIQIGRDFAAQISTMSREERIEFISETLAEFALTKSSTKFWLAATGKALNVAGKGVRKIAQVVEEVNPGKPKAVAVTPEGVILDATEVLEAEANPGKIAKLQEGPAVEGRAAAAAEAKPVVAEGTGKSKYWHADYVEDLSSTQMILGVQASVKGSTTLGSASKAEAWKAGMAWVGKNPKPIYNESNKLIGYSSTDKSRAFRLHYKPRDGKVRANFQEFTPVPQRQNAMTEVKNVHIDILD